MAAVPSQMLPLGVELPEFELPNAVDGRRFHSRELQGGRGALVMFVCNHCPYVVHIREKLLEVAHRALDAGVKVVAVNSNSERTHPQDGPSHMKALALAEGWRFPFLFDEAQTVARSFRAACTPDFYLFDAAGKLFYRGQFDDSRPKNGLPVTGRDLSLAVDAVVANAPPPTEQKASIGCNIKWHPGAEPPWFG